MNLECQLKWHVLDIFSTLYAKTRLPWAVPQPLLLIFIVLGCIIFVCPLIVNIKITVYFQNYIVLTFSSHLLFEKIPLSKNWGHLPFSKNWGRLLFTRILRSSSNSYKRTWLTCTEKCWKIKDDLNIWKMKGNLNLWKMEDDLNFWKKS